MKISLMEMKNLYMKRKGTGVESMKSSEGVDKGGKVPMWIS